MLLSFLYVACVVAAFLLAKPIRNSLFLVEYGPYALVYAYAAVPLVLWLFVAVYAAACRPDRDPAGDDRHAGLLQPERARRSGGRSRLPLRNAARRSSTSG